jgi:hypothetical protein
MAKGEVKAAFASKAWLILWMVISSLSQARAVAPVAPPNLRIAFVTRTELALQWDPAPGATFYRAEYRQTGGVYQSFGPGATLSRTSLMIGELVKGRSYDVQIYAGNSDGLSPPTSLPGVTPTDSPLPPTGVAEAAHTKDTITLTWTPPSNPSATNFRVLLSECRKQIGQAECDRKRPCLTDRSVKCSNYEYYTESGVIKEFTSAPAILRQLDTDIIYFFVVEARNLNIGGTSSHPHTHTVPVFTL